jgi:hypothetical protein
MCKKLLCVNVSHDVYIYSVSHVRNVTAQLNFEKKQKHTKHPNKLSTRNTFVTSLCMSVKTDVVSLPCITVLYVPSANT